VDSRILVAVSSPWASERFVAPICDLATRLQSEVVVAHVTQVKEDDEGDADARQRGEATLKLLTNELSEHGIENAGVMVFSDDVPKAIINTAKDRNCSLIVMGKQGDGAVRGIFRRMFSSDVIQSIVRNSEIPVMLCSTNWRGRV
jgi:nucleotide-binding universal stress UspA family protein